MPFSTAPTNASPFDAVLAPFFTADGLPFANVLTSAQIEQVCQDEHVNFGATKHSFWSPAVVLWTFLSQVLDSAKSCRAAVARACVALASSRPLEDLDTGNYCRARAKLPLAVVQRLTLQVGQALEREALPAWLWHGHHVVLVDGFTVTAPDTPANQARWPQPNTQKPGLGFPLLRIVALLSLATAATLGLAIGPYQGKETGETALLRALLEQLSERAVVLADRHYCSYWMLVLLLARGVDMVVRLHHCRKSDFRRGRRLGRDDHVVSWHRPACPEWMDEELYAAMPEQLTVREIRYQVTKPGWRVKQVHVVTTFQDAEAYPAEEIAGLYHKRWQVELDIRAIKTTMQMDELRCLTPEMVEKEVWMHFLAYNLVRKVAAQAAQERGVRPREISFAASRQVVLAAWSKLTEARAEQGLALARQLLHGLGKEPVGQRPDRYEPRAKKRRPKKLKLLTKPRAQARAELLAGKGAK